MSTIIIETKDKEKASLLLEFAKKFKLKADSFTEDEQDLGLVNAMKKSDRSKTVSKENFLELIEEKLNRLNNQ